MEWSSNHSDWSHMWLIALWNMYVARGTAAQLPHSRSLPWYKASVPTSKENIFLAKKSLDLPVWKPPKKAVMLKWSVRSSIIWYLSEVSPPGWDGATKCVSLFEGNVGVWGVCLETPPLLPPRFQPPSSLAQINPSGLSVDSACKGMSNALLD